VELENIIVAKKAAILIGLGDAIVVVRRLLESRKEVENL